MKGHGRRHGGSFSGSRSPQRVLRPVAAWGERATVGSGTVHAIAMALSASGRQGGVVEGPEVHACWCCATDRPLAPAGPAGRGTAMVEYATEVESTTAVESTTTVEYTISGGAYGGNGGMGAAVILSATGGLYGGGLNGLEGFLC